MKHWKTTLVGVIAAILHGFETGAIHGDNWPAVAASIGIAALGYFAANGKTA